MKIQLNNIGKKFNRTWIFQNLNQAFEPGQHYAITGQNGSGKSTLLQVIAGFLTPSMGKITYQIDEDLVKVEDVYQYFNIASPYLGVLEEFSFKEHLRFHARFKSLLPFLSINEVIALTNLERHQNKELKHFSSGMLQRVRLALALFFESRAILLDEPTAHFDQYNFNWYKEMVENYATNRTLIIASNHPPEFDFCSRKLNLSTH